MNGEPYTAEQVSFLKERGADMSTKDLCVALNEKFGTSHSVQSVRTTAKKHGVQKTKQFRAESASKRGAELGASCVVGGYEYIRNGRGRRDFYQNWQRKCRLVWEAEHGTIPDGHMVVFLNGDTLDCRIENLACVSKAVAARMARGRGRKLWSKCAAVTKAGIKVCELDEAISKRR